MPVRTQFAVFSRTRSNNKKLMIVTTVTVTKPKIRIATREHLHVSEFGKESLAANCSHCRLELDLWKTKVSLFFPK